MKKFELTDKQEELLHKALKGTWVLAIGAALTLVALVYLFSRGTPAPLGGGQSVEAGHETGSR
jgi:hypothetical protein